MREKLRTEYAKPNLKRRCEMRQAIVTKFIGPTNIKGSRVSAKCMAGRIIMDWDHRYGVDKNHQLAAMKLVKKLGWDAHTKESQWRGGAMPDGGYCFVDTKY